MTKQEEEVKQITIDSLTDLDLAEVLSAEQQKLYQTQTNVTALLVELQRRKELLEKKEVKDAK